MSCPHQKLLQLNDKALNVIYEALDPKVFESIKDLEMAHHVCKRLEDSYDDTSAVKESKLYIFKDKYAKFMMLEDESVLFYRLYIHSSSHLDHFHCGQEQKQMIENL